MQPSCAPLCSTPVLGHATPFWRAVQAARDFTKRLSAPMPVQGGFTRVLHSGKPDDLMDEIPTFVVDPLPPEKHNHGSYVVINRPYAFVQWTSR